MTVRIVALALCLPLQVWACPFCDQGGFDAARFILSVFVPMAIAGAFVLVAVLRFRRVSPPDDPSRRIFDAERRSPR